MRIRIDQVITANVEEAQAAFLDPAFYASLGELPGISAPEVRSLSSVPDGARAVLGYRFSGQLNGVARAILDPAKLTWSQITEVDLATHRSQVRMVPDNYAGLLSFSGWYDLRPSGIGTCCQHFEANLVVHVPLVGPLAERAIAGSIRQNIATTAALVERYVATRRRADGPGPVRGEDDAGD
jgi:hypothetical protein